MLRIDYFGRTIKEFNSMSAYVFNKTKQLCAFFLLLTVSILLTIGCKENNLNIPEPVTRNAYMVVELPSPASVHLDVNGRFFSRFRGNVKYLHYQHQRFGQEMLNAYAIRHYAPGKLLELVWDREYAGKWLDAATRTAVNIGEDSLLAMVDAFASSLRQYQQPDGYMGIPLPNNRPLNDWEKAWDIWNEFYALVGLLTHYELRNNRASLEAASRIGNWILTTFSPIKDAHSPFFQGEVDGFTKVVVIGQLIRLYRHTGNTDLLEFVRQVINHFPPIQQMLSSGEPYLVHPYMLSAVLGGMVDFAQVTKDQKMLTKIEQICDGLIQHFMFPTGSLGEREDLTESVLKDVPDGQLQETCATTEWIFLMERLYEATGRAKYIDALELTCYNALLAAQSVDGMKWCYWTPLRYSKHWFHGPTRCCFFSGPRGIARLPQLIYATKGNTIYVNFFESSQATLNTKDGRVKVIQKSDYPASGKSKVKLKPPPNWKGKLRIRVPNWAKNFQIRLNGRIAKISDKIEGYFEIILEDAPEYQVEIKFDIPFWVEDFAGGGCFIRRGPEVLSVDVRDNIDTWLGAQDDLISIPDEITPLPIKSYRKYQWAGPLKSDTNRRVYRVLINDKRTDEPRSVLLTPYADAGNEGAAFRTIFPHARN